MLFSRSLKLAVLALGLLPAACDRQARDPAQGAPADGAAIPVRGSFDRGHRGSAMPDMTFAGANGQQLELGSLKGRPVLINLWATWCAPCVTELSTLENLAASGKVRVVTISQDSGAPDQVTAFLQQRRFTRLQPWQDPQNNLSFHYNTGTLPTTVLYDSKGREVWRYVGEHDWASPEAAAAIAQAN